jgi:predicted metal-dependent phosphoesterase TrpH
MQRLRADLHVHSCHSRQSGNLRFLRSRDCYSDPAEVYRVAKARGMTVVTITDHDSIDGCLELLNRDPEASDFFVSEEVSCRLPDGNIEVHFGVYGMTESLHRDIQPLRSNAFDVAARLREADVLFSLNHLMHFYRGQIPLTRYLRLLDEVPAVEIRNGSMLAEHNLLVAALADRLDAGSRPALRLVALGGSDAHTTRRVGRTWTEAPGTTAADFLASLRAGLGSVGGEHGTAWGVAADAYGVVAAYAASLLGYGPRDHDFAERVAFILFAIAALPAQFLPYAITRWGKWHEARQVRRAGTAIAEWLERRALDPVGTQT